MPSKARAGKWKSPDLTMDRESTLSQRLEFVQKSLQLDDQKLAWYIGLHPKQLQAFRAGRDDLPEAVAFNLLDRTGYLKLSNLVLSAMSRGTREKLQAAQARHAAWLAELAERSHGDQEG